LADAPFWSPAQSRFLREGIADNADWAQVVSELDASLRDFADVRQRPEELDWQEPPPEKSLGW